MAKIIEAKYWDDEWVAVGYRVEAVQDDLPDICSCDPRDYGQGHMKADPEELAANARLIAAAPRMASLLRLLHSEMSAGKLSHLDDEFSDDLFGFVEGALDDIGLIDHAS